MGASKYGKISWMVSALAGVSKYARVFATCVSTWSSREDLKYCTLTLTIAWMDTVPVIAWVVVLDWMSTEVYNSSMDFHNKSSLVLN